MSGWAGPYVVAAVPHPAGSDVDEVVVERGVERELGRVYTSFYELVVQEVQPALRTDETLTDEQIDRLAPMVAQRLEAAGLVVWDDGWSESLQAFWLPAQGFRMVETDDAGAAFWAVVADVLEEGGQS